MGIYINFILFFLFVNADSVISKCGGLFEITWGTEDNRCARQDCRKGRKGTAFLYPLHTKS